MSFSVKALILSVAIVLSLGFSNHGVTADLININTASVKQLMTLKGVGKDKAKAIVDYRVENGQFKSVEELVNVKGIGKKLLKKHEQSLTVAIH